MLKKVMLLMTAVLLCACNGHKNETIKEKTIDKEEPIVTPSYQDENPVIVSLYVDNASGGLDKIGSEMHETWVSKRDIVVFGAVLTNEESLESDYFQNTWKKYAEKYKDNNYKVGWQVSFSLKDGTKIDQMIYKPSDVEDFYDYLELYLYDSANKPIGVWYSHLLDEEMTDETIMTSLKLTAGSKYEEITSPIEVKVFTYDGDDDFDEDGHYRGNSVSVCKVYNG